MGIRQKDVAERIGMSEAHFSTVKNGHNALTRKAAEALEREFGCRADWLLKGEQPVVVEWLGDDEARTYIELFPVPQDAPITKRPTAAVIRRMGYYCESCNGQVAETLAECPHCGAMLDWEVKPKGKPAP